MNEKQHTKPCNECPFRRGIKPDCDDSRSLGGSSPETYIGQASGPFYLPCHKHTNYSDPNWKQDLSKPHCAGAAIFRANIGVSEYLPEPLLKLPEDDETVFGSNAEFLAHHTGQSIGMAQLTLRVYPVQLLVLKELQRVGTTTHLLPKESNEREISYRD